MSKQKFFTVYRLSVIGLMAAMVFVATYFLHFKIPTPLGPTMIQLGNPVCLLAGLLFGPVTGGLAAGIGSAIYDLMDPSYAPEFWITFLMKFIMAYVAGVLVRRASAKQKGLIVGAGICGALSYTVVYTAKTILMSRFVLGARWQVVWATLAVKLPASLINAAISSVVALALYFALLPALRSGGILRRLEAEH